MWKNLLARAARLVRPQRYAAPLNMPTRGAGVFIDERSTLTVPAYVCCVRVISESIAQMDWRVVEAGTTKSVATHPADRLIWREPNPQMDAAVFRELLLRYVLLWGNGYAEIVRDESFRPVAMWPIEPYRVTPYCDARGDVWYRVLNPAGGKVQIPAADMLHVRGLGDALQGFSVLEMMARTLGLSVAQEQSMASQMQYGSRASGALVPYGGGSISDQKAQSIREQWNKQNAGSENHGKVVLLSDGFEFRQMSLPNTDAQLLESRQFSVLDVCRFLRVPPHLVYDLSRATFSNITHQSLEFLRDSAGPWIVKLEQQANRKLVSRARRSQYETKIDPKTTLRMDPETRTKYYRELRDLGALSPNEIREQEGLEPIPGGDVYLVPANMITVEKAGAPPAPQPAPAIDSENPADPGIIGDDESEEDDGN